MSAQLEVGAVGQRRRALVWRTLALLPAITVLWIASRPASPRLTTQNELNTVSVAGALETVFKVALGYRLNSSRPVKVLPRPAVASSFPEGWLSRTLTSSAAR